MRALILAAGWATRMGTLGAGGPKHLLPIGSRTSLDFVADALEAVSAVQRIDVLTHRSFRSRFDAWAAARPTPVGIWDNATRHPEERRGAVADLQYFLDAAQVDETLLVLGGDQVFDFGLDEFAARSAQEPTIGVVDVGVAERVSRYATVELDPAGYIRRLVEKDPTPTTTLAAPAIYGLPAAALGQVRRYLASGGSPDNLGWLAEWLVARGPVRGALLAGRWIDVGEPDEYERACREFGGSWHPPERGR